MPPRRKTRPAPDLETNTPPDLSEDRRNDLPETRPETMPPRSRAREETPAGGGFTPTEDGGNPQHPIHDEDQEDRTSSDYEREIDRLDAAVDRRID